VSDLTPEPSQSPSIATHTPDYIGLVKFLVTPFLESPDSLKVDCEVVSSRARVLLRVAFDGEDKGRVFGRGGRNIQAIRTVLQSIAQTTGYVLHLDVYGSQSGDRDGGSRDSGSKDGGSRGGGSERRSSPKPPPRRSRPRSD
jgi:predicted RNA-binding protein YlqC (UPF0109 family)